MVSFAAELVAMLPRRVRPLSRRPSGRHPVPARLALMAALAAAPFGVQAASQTMFGESHARLCYEHARAERANQRAIEDCDVAISSEGLRRPDLASTYSNRGILHARRGDTDQALADYDRALELNPAAVASMINRANLLTRLGRHEEALAEYEAAIFYSQGRNALVYYNRSLVHERLGRPAEARADLLRAVRLRPESRRYREALATLE